MSKRDWPFVPANPEQAIAATLFRDCDILILRGPAGSGKTHVAVALAAEELAQSRATRLILTRPVVPAGEELGFLPGTLERKMGPWLAPIQDVLRRVTHTKPDDFFKQYVEIAPIAYLRGRTFDRCVAILDEAQNASYEQIKLFLTRIGPRCKLILAGDSAQTDRPDSGFAAVCTRLKGLSGISIVDLSSANNPRHSLIPAILERL